MHHIKNPQTLVGGKNNENHFEIESNHENKIKTKP